MFGLDARIALAIFGALSVIVGASLFKAIEQAKITAHIVELEEMAKAVEAYMIDVGTDFPSTSGDVNYLKFQELVESAAVGWKGPYLQTSIDKFNLSSTRNTISYDVYSYGLMKLSSDDWSVGSMNYCDPAEKCYYWVYRCDNPGNNRPTSTIELIDAKIDDLVSSTTGKYRYILWGTGYYCAYYQGPRLINQP